MNRPFFVVKQIKNTKKYNTRNQIEDYIASFEKNCEQNIPATAFLWGYDSMGRPVDTLNPGYKNAQKALIKIEALTGLSLKNHEDLFTLELCLMITSPHLDTL